MKTELNTSKQNQANADLLALIISALIMIGIIFFVTILPNGTDVSSANMVHNIAIIQHQKFEPYYLARNAFIRNLERYCKCSYRIVEDFNAESDLKALDKKVKELASRKDIDLIFSIGTHSTKRMILATKEIPIVFTIIGDPEGCGIVKDWKSSGTNYTGVETPNYYEEVIRLAHTFVPFKDLGMIYLVGSPSHEGALKQIKALSKELGFKYHYTGFPLRDENKVPYAKEVIRSRIRNSLASVCPNVDVFFVQTSNTFTREFDIFKEAFVEYGVLGIGDTLNIKNGLALGIGKDASRFGRQCAEYAAQILDGIPPSKLPMDVGIKLTVDINLTAFAIAEYAPSFNLISGADNVYQ